MRMLLSYNCSSYFQVCAEAHLGVIIEAAACFGFCLFSIEAGETCHSEGSGSMLLFWEDLLFICRGL